MNYSYITLLSSKDYLPGVLALHESLKDVQSRFPFAVGVTDNIYEDKIIDILQQNGCVVHCIPTLEYCQQTKKWCIDHDWNEAIFNTASKISLFELTEYDKLVYIDADTFVLENIDDLFGYPDTSMVSYHEDDYNMGFSGLMVFQPKYHHTDFYKILLENTICCDGNLLGHMWNACKTDPRYQIPREYLVTYDATQANTWILSHQVKCVHFLNHPKPWKQPGDISVLDVHYKQLIDRLQDKYNLDSI